VLYYANMSRRFPISILLMAALAIALAIALRSVIGQRKTIADLRAQIQNADSASPAPAPSLNEPAPAPTPEPTSIVPVPPVAAASNLNTMVASAALGSLRQQNEIISAKLQELENELAQTKRLVPEPEDSTAAYVGPGTWLNANGQTRGITKIVISGEARSHAGFAPTMKIAAWGRCMPTDCEWGEVPFFLLNAFRSETTYRRGFAVWDSEGWSKYLIVAFEKTGLKAECITVSKEQPASFAGHQRAIETMTRIN
jgi:hypothetical protein